LQEYVNARAKNVGAITIKKELDTLRVAWNFGLRRGLTDMPFPGKGVIYPKTQEKGAFISLTEMRQRVAAGGDLEKLSECLYLTPEELAELLDHVQAKKGPAWNYPMFVFAGHTGARKSEMIRSRVEDINMAGRVATIREKKKTRGKDTTRRVPISPLLAKALTLQLEAQRGKTYLFGPGDAPLSVQAVHQAFERAVKGTTWEVLSGWHTLRHSFISACASRGLDQRYIDEWVGHQTAEQQRRYRHLYPSTQAAALSSVFG
jgi:integrase